MDSQICEAVPITTNVEGETESVDRNTSGSSLSPIPTNPLNPSIPIPAAVLPRISEKESQLASEVGRHVNEGNYEAAFIKLDKGGVHGHGPMTTLLELRPDDSFVAANGYFIAYMAGKSTLDEFQFKLQTLYNGLALSGAGELDDGEQCTLLYNLALSYFRKREFKTTEQILKRLNDVNSSSGGINYSSSTGNVGSSSQSASLQGASSSSSNIPSADVEFCQRRVLPLLVSTCLALRQPIEAIYYMNEMTSGNPENLEAVNMYQILSRARALVQMRQHKLFKRDLKSSGLQGSFLTAYEFLRSNLEYMKGNHRKALKLLGVAMQQHQSAMSATEQSEITNCKANQSQNMNLYISSMYTNNMGCINLMLRKPNHGVLYFERALTQHIQCITSDLFQQIAPIHKEHKSEEKTLINHQTRKDVFLRIKQNEIAYNLGVALLHAGNPQKAFDTLCSTITVFGGISASLWLHLAECCITAHGEYLAIQRGESGANDHMKRLSRSLYDPNGSTIGIDGEKNIPVVKLTVVGYGDHRKIILSNSNLPNKRKENQREDNSDQTKPKMSLEFAYYCLKNALVIANKQIKYDESQAAMTIPLTSHSNSSLPKSGSTSNSNQTSPNKSIPSALFNTSIKWQMLRSTILLNVSYVSLCLSDPVIALENAENILSFESQSTNGSSFGIPTGYKMLAHIYAADALIQLDRISEAIAHVDPTGKAFSQIEFSFSLDSISYTSSNSAEDNTDATSAPKNSSGKKASVVKQQVSHSEVENNISGNGTTGSPRRQPPSPTVAALFQYNLIVAIAVRGELEKADEMVEILWKKNGKRTQIYFNLCDI
jgi:hypothetical protein